MQARTVTVVVRAGGSQQQRWCSLVEKHFERSDRPGRRHIKSLSRLLALPREFRRETAGKTPRSTPAALVRMRTLGHGPSGVAGGRPLGVAPAMASLRAAAEMHVRAEVFADQAGLGAARTAVPRLAGSMEYW